MKKTLSVIMSLIMLLSVVTVSGFTVSARVPDSANVEQVTYDGTREIEFNDNWQFYLATRTPEVAGGSGASGFRDYGIKDAGDYTTDEIISVDFDDSSWRTLSVPHDFSIEGEKVPESNTSQGYMLGGLGWYRKTFTVPESLRENGKRVLIDFEGVYQNSIVYLNGEEIGNYPNGYTGFSYDLTDRLNYGEDNPNVIVVKVQNMSPSGRWYTGSGITRPVNLIVTDAVRITRNGVKLSSDDLETTYNADGSATLDVSVSTYSDASNGLLSLKTTVYDAEGNVVAEKELADPIETNPSNQLTITDSIKVPDVKLWYPWNLGDPYLYNVKTELIYSQNGGEGPVVADTVETTYGFRWFKVEEYNAEDPTQGGLYVNGQYTKINGVDLHADLGALGAISNVDAFEYRFEQLKEMGVNAYRTSHCPPAKEIIEVCSRLGFLVAEEAYDGMTGKATYDFGVFYMQEVPEDWAGFIAYGYQSAPQPATYYNGAKLVWSDWVIQEMVARDYNEPSVIMWSIGNEVRGTPSRPSWYDGREYDPLGVVNSASTLNIYTEYARLIADVKAVDDSRPIVYGGDQQRNPSSVTSNPWGYVTQIVDGYGLNYNTATSVDVLMDRFAPYGTFFFESESASMTSSRGVYYDANLMNTGSNLTPGRRGGSSYDNDFASWTMPFEYSIKKDRDRKAFTGQFIWTGFDYIGEPTPYSVYPVGVSSFGVIDTAGFPKDAFYLYKSQWTSGDTDPMVHISPMNWDSWEDGEDVSVWVYSNVERVDLYLNDELVGSKSFDKKVTDYGYEYYETSEYVADDKTWGDESNPGGYVSENSEVVEANGDSEIAEGAKFGRLHLTWDIPYEEGELVAKAYNEEGELVAVDSIATSGVPYTIEAKVNKNVIAADGDSLAYVECTIVDEDGNMVADADNLVKFDVTGGAIAGVDNGAQESAELYKWGNVEKNTHSERSAYNGKVLAILQSNEGETGEMVLTISSEGLAPVQVKVAVTEDGTGEAPEAVTSEVEFNSINDTKVSVPVGVVPTLPSIVSVNYTDSVNGSYSVNRSVVWDEIDASDVGEVGIFSVYGTVDGIEEKAEAVINVERVMESQDISTNPALEDNDDTYDFSQLPEDSEIRNGALATASFTGSSRSYPNNMVDGDQNGVWTNAYNRSATALLPAVNASKPASSVEFYWDSVRVAEKISLYFTVDGSNAIPADFDVQYWDGENWVSASGQNVVKAEASNGETVLTFDPVVTTRVKVLMTNATPYSATGNMTISNAVVYGWNLNTEEEEPGTVITAPESAIKNETFEVSVLTEQDISGITVKNENDRTVTTHITSMNQDTADGKLTVFTLAVGTAGTGRVLSVYDGETLLGTFTLDIEEVPSSIVSVTAPESALEDELFRITAVTTRDLFKGKVYNENGGVIRSTRVSVSYNGDYAESIYELSVGTAFDTARKLTFKADYDKHNDFPFAYDFEIMINEA